MNSYRHVMAAMILCSTLVAYIGRINLSTAIVSMTHKDDDSSDTTSDVCPSEPLSDFHLRSSPVNITIDTSVRRVVRDVLAEGEFDWDHKMQGIILGSFFWSYSTFQVIGGRFSELFGPRLLCFIAIFGTGLCNLASPVLARWNVYSFITSRVVLGALQAIIFPASFALVAKWTPDNERSMVLSFTTVGGLSGSIIASTLSGYLCKHDWADGWPGVFYVTGIINCVFAFIYYLLVADSPKQSRFVSEAERCYITAHIKAKHEKVDDRRDSIDKKNFEIESPRQVPAKRVPWRRVFTNRAFYAIVFTRLTMHCYYNIVTLKIPAYMQQVLKMPLEMNGNYSSIIFFAMATSHFVGGLTADKMVKSGRWRKTTVRKIFESIGTLGTAALFCLISLTDCDQVAFLLLMVGSMLTQGMQAGGEFPIASDLTNRFSATIFGISNFVAMTTGFILPLVIGAVLDEHPDRMRQQWWNIFYAIAGLNIVGGAVFLLFATAEPQGWDYVDENLELEEREIEKTKKKIEAADF